MMNRTNTEPLHHEQGAYRNWYTHYRNQWVKSWRFWMRDKQLINGGNSQRPRKGKKK